MFPFILRRSVISVVVIWVIITVTFFLMKLCPGGPFDRERSLPEAIENNIRARYGFDLPVWQQYLKYLGPLLRGDLGPSYHYQGQSVGVLIADKFPRSATIGLLSILISIAVGVPAGIFCSVRQNRPSDRLTMLITIVGVSVPSFILATVLQYVAAVRWGLFNVAGLTYWYDAILPALALSGYSLAFITRLTRSSFLDVLRDDWVRTAYAKGLAPLRVLVSHVLRNAIVPVVTYLGPLTAAVLTGSLVVEKIFSIPGLGEFFVTSVFNRDYPMIMGVTIFYSTLLVALNFLVDVIYVWLDPRISFGGIEG
ncbi:MAG: peptide ABC transporter permease [Acidithiobacillales bacterium SM23_46]|nr:MAG: peptide ABC transporter permease [Acidithiobacillales bacterium SM23_46]